MSWRIGVLIISVVLLSGCIAIPDMSAPEHLGFDYVPSGPPPVSGTDALCCDKCAA